MVNPSGKCAMLDISTETKDSVIYTADIVIRFVMNALLVCPACYAHRRNGLMVHTDDCSIGQFIELIDELK